jgi:integrase
MATVKFYLKNSKAKDGVRKDEVGIVAKVTLDRTNRFEVVTGERIAPRYWDGVRQEVKTSFRGAIDLNLSLTRIKSDLVQLWRDNKSEHVDTLKDLARNLVKYGQQGTPVQKKTLINVLNAFIGQYKTEKDSKTVAKYKGLLAKLILFSDQRSLTLEDINFSFYDAFKAFLYAQPNPLYSKHSIVDKGDYWLMVEGNAGEPVGLFDDTVYKYFINLRTVLRWATKREYVINQSFEKWEIITRTYPPISLTLAELEKLESQEFTHQAIGQVIETKKETRIRVRANSLDTARDYLVMESRTGQRISDIKRFDPKDYSDYKWTLTLTKGNRLKSKRITIHFKGYCAPALMILAKHGFKMPAIAESNLNDNIKTACRVAGIDQEMFIERWVGNKKVRITGKKYEFISTHTGRKTFITIALQFMPPKLVMDLAGIDSYATLKHYEGQSEDGVIEKYLESIPESKPIMRKAQ